MVVCLDTLTAMADKGPDDIDLSGWVVVDQPLLEMEAHVAAAPRNGITEDGEDAAHVQPEDAAHTSVGDGHSSSDEAWNQREITTLCSDFCSMSLFGGDRDASNNAFDAGVAARSKGVSAGITKLMRVQGARPLLQAIATEYWNRQVAASPEPPCNTLGEDPTHRLSVVFDSRPFGMTPAKFGGAVPTIGYCVDKVSQNDQAKPAARLGVKPGWVAVNINGLDVRGLPLQHIQRLLKEADLPIKFEFEVPPHAGHEKMHGVHPVPPPVQMKMPACHLFRHVRRTSQRDYEASVSFSEASSLLH